VQTDAPLGRLPLYLRAGSALPVSPPAQHTAETATLPLRFRVCPAERIAGTLYLDDGVSMGYEEGEYSLLRLEGGERAIDGARPAGGPGAKARPEQPAMAAGRLRVTRESGTLQPVLGGHPSLTVELTDGSEGQPGRSAAVNADELPWEWSYAG
jgi:hypothetical protein